MYEEGYFWSISLLNSLVMSLPVSSLHLFVVSFYLSVLLEASPVLDSISFSLWFALPWIQGKQFLCRSLCSVHTGFVLRFHTNLALLLSWEHSLRLGWRKVAESSQDSHPAIFLTSCLPWTCFCYTALPLPHDHLLHPAFLLVSMTTSCQAEMFCY